MGLWAGFLDVITAEELYGTTSQLVELVTMVNRASGAGLTLVGRKLPMTSDRLETEAVVPMVR